MKFKKVLVMGLSQDSMDKKYWDAIVKLSEKLIFIEKDSPDVPKELADTDCLLVWFNGVDKAAIDSAPNLKYIGAMATGVGKIDTDYARSKGIVVTNVPGYSTEGVAEFEFAALLEYLRDISRAKTASKKERTPESGFRGSEIKGKDFGVIGLGQIGNRVGEIASGFGANVFYTSRSAKSKSFTREDIDTLIEHCEFISINLALNSETEGVLNAERITAIKKNAVVINTAPHELIDMEALNKRLDQGDIVYIFDHSDPDDISDEDLKRLRDHDNCIVYPVLGYITDEATIAKQEIFVENAKAALEGKPQNQVNA